MTTGTRLRATGVASPAGGVRARVGDSSPRSAGRLRERLRSRGRPDAPLSSLWAPSTRCRAGPCDGARRSGAAVECACRSSAAARALRDHAAILVGARAAVVRPAVDVEARVAVREFTGERRRHRTHRQTGDRPRLLLPGGPPCSAVLALVLLAGHRRLAGGAQARDVSVAHGSALPRRRRRHGLGGRRRTSPLRRVRAGDVLVAAQDAHHLADEADRRASARRRRRPGRTSGRLGHLGDGERIDLGHRRCRRRSRGLAVHVDPSRARIANRRAVLHG
jgi:hypothetical protein